MRSSRSALIPTISGETSVTVNGVSFQPANTQPAPANTRVADQQPYNLAADGLVGLFEVWVLWSSSLFRVERELRACVPAEPCRVGRCAAGVGDETGALWIDSTLS